MLSKISERFVSWQIKKNLLPSEERDVYVYAYEVLLGEVLNVCIAIIIAMVLHAPVLVFFFLASYIPLRSYCGGYHARTNSGCMVVSAFIVIAVCIVVRAISGVNIFWMQTICFAISGFFVIRYAPVADLNKPLDEAETICYRKRSLSIWTLEVAVGFLLLIFKLKLAGLTIAISHIVLSIMLCLGLLIQNHVRSRSK